MAGTTPLTAEQLAAAIPDDYRGNDTAGGGTRWTAEATGPDTVVLGTTIYIPENAPIEGVWGRVERRPDGSWAVTEVAARSYAEHDERVAEAAALVAAATGVPAASIRVPANPFPAAPGE